MAFTGFRRALPSCHWRCFWASPGCRPFPACGQKSCWSRPRSISAAWWMAAAFWSPAFWPPLRWPHLLLAIGAMPRNGQQWSARRPGSGVKPRRSPGLADGRCAGWPLSRRGAETIAGCRQRLAGAACLILVPSSGWGCAMTAFILNTLFAIIWVAITAAQPSSISCSASSSRRWRLALTAEQAESVSYLRRIRLLPPSSCCSSRNWPFPPGKLRFSSRART